jgi:hypothetical protein
VLLFLTAEKYAPKASFKIVQLLNKADSIEAIAVGNSHSCAIDFNALGINGYRIAEGGNDISEVEYQVKSLIPLLPNLKTIFFNISYFSLYADNNSFPCNFAVFTKIEYEQFLEKFPYAASYLDTILFSNCIVIDTDKISTFRKNKLGYAFDYIVEHVNDPSKVIWGDYNSIPVVKWVRGDFWNYFLNRISVVVRIDHWADILINILSADKQIDSSSLSDHFRMDIYGQSKEAQYYSYKNRDSLDILAKNFIVPKYLGTREIVLKNNRNVLQENYDILISIIEYLRTNDIRIIFYTSPVFESFTQYYDKSTIRIMKNKMESLQEKYNIEYYDFSSDTFFIMDNRLFYNSDHLNKNGAKEFSKKLSVLLLSAEGIENSLDL